MVKKLTSCNHESNHVGKLHDENCAYCRMENTWLSLVVENLTLLKDAFADGVIPTMLYDGDEEEKIIEIQKLINYLNKTN